MKPESQQLIREKVRSIEVTQRRIILLLVSGFLLILFLAVLFQIIAENSAFSLNRINPRDTLVNKSQYEVYKLAAEIRQIRSDTSGSLFWLKLVALFVTVGGAVGGYLFGQERVNKNRLSFEQRKNIDATYQAIIQELSGSEPVLRATAAVKLGAIIRDFPSEWNISGDDAKNEKRRNELIQLTKNVLAAALSIEQHAKVLKAITIALVPKSKVDPEPGQTIADLSMLDFSHAAAHEAYWANVDLSRSDFFGADLKNASLRGSRLYKTSFYQADLNKAVFANADCREAYFSLARLQGANFEGADLRGVTFKGAEFDGETNFENARVFGATFTASTAEQLKAAKVDVAEQDNEAPRWMRLQDWIHIRPATPTTS